MAVVDTKEMNRRRHAGTIRTRRGTPADVAARARQEPWNYCDGVLHLRPPSNHRRVPPAHSTLPPDAPFPRRRQVTVAGNTRRSKSYLHDRPHFLLGNLAGASTTGGQRLDGAPRILAGKQYTRTRRCILGIRRRFWQPRVLTVAQLHCLSFKLQTLRERGRETQRERETMNGGGERDGRDKGVGDKRREERE